MNERRVKFWLATNGSKHRSSGSRDEWGAAAGGSVLITIVAMIVFGLPSALLTGDPFSDWVWTDGKDEIVPWFEEGLATIACIGIVIALSCFLRYLWVSYQYSVTSSFRHGVEETALYTYRKLPADDRKRMKGPLIELLTYPNKSTSDPVFKKHKDAWNQLHNDVNEHERLMLETQSTSAATRIEDLSSTYRHQINQLKNEKELT